MKRSEMLEKMVFSMELHAGNDPAWLDQNLKLKQAAYDYAEKILRDLEDEGMLPPVENEHWLDRVGNSIDEEHKENHGYPITSKRKYYAIRGAVLGRATKWTPEDEV